MRIINVCRDDFANFSYENAQALKSIGIDAESFKLIPHSFGYPIQSPIVSLDTMTTAIAHADVVQVIHNDEKIFNLCLQVRAARPSDKPLYIIPYHSCTSYRNDPDKYNRLWNPHIELSFTNQCEFMNLGSKNLHYITTAIDPDKYNFSGWETKDRVTLAHYPSNSVVKGTGQILCMLQQVSEKVNLKCSMAIVDSNTQLKRMYQCDIYIELFSPTLYGKPYGCYGVTAFEAAAMGKIVVTQNIHKEVYEKEYGKTEFFIANTEKEFIDTIEYLISLPKDQIAMIGQKAKNWVRENHSYRATGERIMNIIRTHALSA